MPPTSIEKMLETVILQLLNPVQNPANTVCSAKKYSQTCCQCGKNYGSDAKKKKRRRKPKKSCLRTIICLTKMARDRCECQDNSNGPSSRIPGEDGDERYCSKCGQLLPGMLFEEAQVNIQPDLSLHHEPIKPESNDIGVQVEPKNPLSVRIKVCPCPFNNSKNHDEKLYHSVSSPELSKTNPRLVEDATSENLVIAQEPHSSFADNRFNESQQPHQPVKGLGESTSEWPVDVASMKRLALKIAKARILEESACREREHARRWKGQMGEERIDDIDPKQSANSEKVFRHQTYVGLQVGHEPPQHSADNARHMSRATNPLNTNYYGTCLKGFNEYPGTSNLDTQDMAVSCCGSTKTYCYSPENGYIPYSDYCEHSCTCQNIPRFQPCQLTESGQRYPYQPTQLPEDCGSEGRYSRYPYSSCSQRARSPCR